jgi:perosamine synthetase
MIFVDSWEFLTMSEARRLAIDGGQPVRSDLLPYSRQTIDENDLEAVLEVMRSDWLTTGPAIERFERAFSGEVGTQHSVAVSSGTAALHTAMFCLDIKPGDEVIVPAMTFAATANCIVYQGGTPIFCDVDPETLLIDPEQVAARLSPKTRAVIAVDYAGQACDYGHLSEVVADSGIPIVADACHALGGEYQGKPVGSIADLSTFSFHPVKNIATGEGGMISTDDDRFARRARRFRNHGITTDHHERSSSGSWHYRMTDLGFNYRLTDIQCALGLAQLARLEQWISRRRELAQLYRERLEEIPGLEALSERPDLKHAYHLFVVRLTDALPGQRRDPMFSALRAEGIGVNVHYIPVHLHPFYRERFGTAPGDLPVAEDAYRRILTLPLFPTMSDRDFEDVISALKKVCSN